MEFLRWLLETFGPAVGISVLTIFFVLTIQNRESRILEKSIKTNSDMTIENSKSLKTLQKDYRDLLQRYIKARDAFHKTVNALNLLKEQYLNDRQEWEDLKFDLSSRIRLLEKELEDLKQQLLLKDAEIVRLKRAV